MPDAVKIKLTLTQQQGDNLANMLDLACKAGGLQVIDAVHELTQLLREAAMKSQQQAQAVKEPAEE